MKKYDLQKIHRAALLLSQTSERSRNLCLLKLAKILHSKQKKIILANKLDLLNAQKRKQPVAMIERLKFDAKRIIHTIHEIQAIIKLDSGIGKVLETRILDRELKLQKVAAPLGVILIIYESRPEVTIDVAALCIKSGNGGILKGGSEAMHTNKVLYACIVEALRKSKLDEHTITFVKGRDETKKLLQENDFIDLVIARGGYAMVKTVQAESKIPVLAHSSGGARIYVDQSANTTIATKIIINAKTSNPATCNSLDTIVVHEKIAKTFIPHIVKELQKRKVKIVKDHWTTEFLALQLSIKVVRNLEEAIIFINRYGKHHSEGIVAGNRKMIRVFTKAVDAAAIFVNCSTRLHDGYIFGLGSEMGIATGKLHARGPVGLRELLTYTWHMYGNGQIRK